MCLNLTQVSFDLWLGLWIVVLHLLSLTFTLLESLNTHVRHALHLIEASVQILWIRPQDFGFYASMLHLLAWENILTLLCSWVSYGKRCHYMLSIFNQFFWNFHNLKRLLKDLRTEGIKSYPPLISDFINHSCNFWDFLSLKCVLVELISYNNQCPESWNLSYSLVVHPICTWKTKMFVFHFLVLTLLYLLYTC